MQATFGERPRVDERRRDVLARDALAGEPARGRAAADVAPAGDVHPWSAAWCELLGRILAGRAAANLLGDLAGRFVGVVVLPSFLLVDPKLDLGRKALGRGGQTLRFPARVIWSEDAGESQLPTGPTSDQPSGGDQPRETGQLAADPPEVDTIGPVLLVRGGGERRLRFEAVGVGVRVSGTTIVRAGRAVRQPMSLPPPATVASGPIPEAVVVPAASRRAVIDGLQRIALDGTKAFWQARQMLECHGDWVLRRRLAAVTAEIGPAEGERLLDETDLEVVRDELLLGDDGGRVSPAYDRIIERCLAPNAFARVDPQHRVMRSLRSATETALRRRIGDPHVGRKVRQLMHEESLESLGDLVGRYGERWPKDRVGVRRIEAALLAAHATAPMSSSDLDAASEDLRFVLAHQRTADHL